MAERKQASYDEVDYGEILTDCNSYQFEHNFSLEKIRDEKGNEFARQLLELRPGHPLLDGICDPAEPFKLAKSSKAGVQRPSREWITNTFIGLHPTQFINNPEDFVRNCGQRMIEVDRNLDVKTTGEVQSAIYEHLDKGSAVSPDEVGVVLQSFARSHTHTHTHMHASQKNTHASHPLHTHTHTHTHTGPLYVTWVTAK